ncbi:MAG: hypothetical protein F4X98_03310, partial [Gammaproteobacteria bacterium]|nr:hypothetical protein [Gammaproteobacteria bacterium]
MLTDTETRATDIDLAIAAMAEAVHRRLAAAWNGADGGNDNGNAKALGDAPADALGLELQLAERGVDDTEPLQLAAAVAAVRRHCAAAPGDAVAKRLERHLEDLRAAPWDGALRRWTLAMWVRGQVGESDVRWESPEPGLDGVRAITTWRQAAYIRRLQHHITGTVAEVAVKVDDPEALRHFYAIGDPWTSGTAVTIVQDPADRLTVEYHFGTFSRDPNPAERAYADALVQAIADAARDGRATWEASWQQARAAARNEPTPPLT